MPFGFSSNDTGKGLVEEVLEKQVISNLATVEVYVFSSAAIMPEAIQTMFFAQDTTLGEYYVAPAYNYMIKQEHPFDLVNLGPIDKVMHGLGIPADFE